MRTGRIVLAIVVVVLGGGPLFAHSPARPAARDWTDARIESAADQLLAAVTSNDGENEYFPQFAIEKLAWLVSEREAGRLSIVLLKDISKTSLKPDDLMGSTTIGGHHWLVISQPRFTTFLRESGGLAAPFRRQQRNDFMLGLVHEVVHLQGLPDRSSRGGLVREESRTWREVSLNVVRPLRWLHQEMHRKFTQVDEALRQCADQLPCLEFNAAVFR